MIKHCLLKKYFKLASLILVITILAFIYPTKIANASSPKVIYYPKSAVNFESLEQLTDWCEEHIVNLWITGNHTSTCVDYAQYMQFRAYRDGYLISCQLVYNGKLFNVDVTDIKEYHMGNLAITKDKIYFIEPQPKHFKITLVCDKY